MSCILFILYSKEFFASGSENSDNKVKEKLILKRKLSELMQIIDGTKPKLLKLSEDCKSEIFQPNEYKNCINVDCNSNHADDVSSDSLDNLGEENELERFGCIESDDSQNLLARLDKVQDGTKILEKTIFYLENECQEMKRML